MRRGSWGWGIGCLAVLSGCYASVVTGEAEGDAPARDMASPAPDGGLPVPDLGDPGPDDLGVPPVDMPLVDMGRPPVELGTPDVGVDLGTPDAGIDLGPPLGPDLMRCRMAPCLLEVTPVSGSRDVRTSTSIFLLFNTPMRSDVGTLTLIVDGEERVLNATDPTTFALLRRDLDLFRPGYFEDFEGAFLPGSGLIYGFRLTPVEPFPRGAVVELIAAGDWQANETGIRLDAAADPLARGVFRTRD
ncbi:MAG: hypothetical protein AAGH15_21490 [Myxococcota bacterium]